jgi:ubiquinone/menaquinone biosynthesis C-methylase UbiE
MQHQSVGLKECLLHEDHVPRSSWKSIVIPSLFIGLGLAALVLFQNDSVQQSSVDMAWQTMQPTRAQHFTQPRLFPTRRGVAPSKLPTPLWQSAQPARDQRLARPVAAVAPPAPAVADTSVTAPQRTEVTPPGVAENEHFKCDKSVAFWKNRQGGKSGIENLQEASSVVSSIAAKGSSGQQYILAHGLRTGYMAVNGVLGVLAFALSQGGQPEGNGDGESDASGGGLLSGGFTPSAALDLASGFLLASALCFQQDYDAIQNGMFKMPWDMFTPGHRQNTPQYALDKTMRFISEAPQTLGRRAREAKPGVWLDSPFYPDYYKNDFHYQTDGWFSPNSAKVYETSTETLFLGRQDAMQRLSLLPLRSVASVSDGAPRILEVACGTGRFGTFIRDNHPNADVTLSDLSPFYLEAARENDDYWRKMRYPNENTRPPSAKFVQAAAEKLPFEDASFDAVVCVYLFHEMPQHARAAAAAEMARVVAPGGIVILTDSAQRGDLFAMSTEGAKAFGKLNEPHYVDYVDTYLPALFTEAGLECDGKWVESATKCLSFRKPAAQEVSGEAKETQEAGSAA